MSETDSIVVAAAERILGDLCDPQTVNGAADDAWKAPLWRALEESGLTLSWVPEDLGGAGVDVTDGFQVLKAAGSFAAPIPIAETSLAGWLLARAGVKSPTGAMTVAPVRIDDRITLGTDGNLAGRARGVPFARDADHIALIAHRGEDRVVALVNRSSCEIVEKTGLAGDASDDVAFENVAPSLVSEAPQGLDGNALFLMGAAVRSSLMAGALQAILDMSVEYAKQRVQFERPIAKFQAVQHNLARLAGEASAAISAAASAAESIARSESFDEHVFLEIASAKIRVGEAAAEGAAIAHQVHGAIGFTKDHILHRFTHRLLSWRDDFGGESHWAERLGRMIAEKGADKLWPFLTAS